MVYGCGLVVNAKTVLDLGLRQESRGVAVRKGRLGPVLCLGTAGGERQGQKSARTMVTVFLDFMIVSSDLNID